MSYYSRSSPSYDGKYDMGPGSRQEITAVGILVINAKVNPTLGVPLLNQGGYDAETFPKINGNNNMIRNGDFMWTLKSRRGIQPDGGTAFSATTRSSFNSFGTGGYETAEDIAEDVYVLGFALMDAAETDPNKGDVPAGSNMTVKVGGTGSIDNIGPDTFYPGDLIYAQFPKLDESKRNEMQANIPHFDNTRDPTKITCIPRRFRPSKINSIMKQAARLIIDPLRIKSNPIDLQASGVIRHFTSSAKPSPYTALALALKEVELTKCMQFIGYLADTGLIILPGQLGVPLTEVNFKGMKAAINTVFVSGTAAATWGNLANNNQGRQRSMLALAARLGLVSDPNLVKQDMELQRQLLIQSLGWAADNISVKEDGSVTTLTAVKEQFKRNFSVDETAFMNYPGRGNTFKKTAAGQYWFLRLPRAANLNTLWASFYSRILERVKARCNSFAPKGWKIHYII